MGSSKAKRPVKTRPIMKSARFKDSKDVDSLTSFLYTLLRDYCLPGDVERVVQDVEANQHLDIIYSNGHLANYARELGLLILSK